MAQNGFWDEIRKIPPVTRFLCGSSLAVSLPSMLKLVHPYTLIFVRELVMNKYQVWRLWTSIFFGSSGINYIFEFIMLYRNSLMLEDGVFSNHSSDYAWHLIFASGAIIGLNIPLGSFVHNRAFLMCLTYLSSNLAPPGTQTSLFGLLTLDVAYFPYALIGLDFLMGGPMEAARSITGAVVGHLWWWLVFRAGSGSAAGIPAWSVAPAWLRSLIGDHGPPRLGRNSGVQVVEPRQRAGAAQPAARATGYNWGSGQRLGTE